MILSCLNEENSIYDGNAQEAVVPLRQMCEKDRREFFAHLALRHCHKIGIRTISRLLKYYKSAYTAIENRKNWPEASVNNECGIEYGKELWREKAQKEWTQAAKSGASILLWTSELYPGYLREIIDPPSFLYCKGNKELLKTPMVAIVGSRKASRNGLRITNTLAKALAKMGITVISGMALGIDRQAHLAAVEEIGSSIGVLGTGINILYPGQNKDIYAKMYKDGLIISEFPPDLPPKGINFPIRNRLISGLSLGIIVIEAAERSGSLITAKYALEQNREVFAVPGQPFNIHSLGCQNLIRQGAHSVFSIEDVIGELGELLKTFSLPDNIHLPDIPPIPEHNDEIEPEISFQGKEHVEQCCFGDISDKIIFSLKKGSRHIEELAEELDENINEINSKLIFLELLGKIRRLPGARFELI